MNKKGLRHGVYRDTGFPSSRMNCVSLPPLLQASVAPPFGSKGEETLVCGGGGGGDPIPTKG
jgi:hypothetical protein